MQEFKLNIYKNEKGHDFIEYKSLNLAHCEDIIKELALSFSLSLGAENLFIILAKHLKFIDLEESKTYQIESLINDFEFSQQETLFIIWSENEIDEISTEKLISVWEYIWYGDSDDAVILYQPSNQRILLITHYGRIFYS